MPSFVQAQAQIYCSGDKCVELSVQNELAVYPLGMGQYDHVISEFFENPVIPEGVGVTCFFRVNILRKIPSIP